jgi:hypothetical protein
MNLGRRDLLKSQHAMLYAIAYPDPTPAEERRAGEVGKNSLPIVSKQLISYARTVLREFGADSDEVKQIVAGASLKNAYEWVLEQRRRKQEFAALLEEQQRASREAAREAEQEAERLRRRIYLNGEVKDAIEWFKQTYRVHPLTAALRSPCVPANPRTRILMRGLGS